MKIEDSDVGIIKKWIEDHWKGEPLCPVCKNNNWTIGGTIAELRPFLKGKFRTSGPVYPVIVFSCNVCGNVLFFNAIQLGIVKIPPAPPPKEGDGVVSPLKEAPSTKEGDGVVSPLKEKDGDDNG